MPSPFDFADVVTSTTHKSLRGPRGSLIFYRKGVRTKGTDGRPDEMYDFEAKVNEAVFPGLQGGPHNHTIGALAVALKQAQTPEFVQYQAQVLLNAKALENKFKELGYTLVSNGTDNHLITVDVRASRGVSGAKAERICEMVNIVLNKNTVPGDKSAMNPSGLRVGTPAMTSRGLLEDDFTRVGEFLGEAVNIACEVQKQSGPKLVDFKTVIAQNPPASLNKLKAEVKEFATKFDTIAF